MSNLLKRVYTVNKDERVIDYNDLIKKKLEAIMESKHAAVDTDGFVSGLNADVVEELISDDSSEELIQDSGADSDQSAAALENADTAFEEAKQNGYYEGCSKADAEIEKKQQELETEYNKKKSELENEYNELKDSIEPELVEVITDVFRKVTGVVTEDNHDIILHLINDVMHNADASRDFVIKVSPDDYSFLINNQGKIYCAMSREVNIDIVEDVTLERNQCMIETNTGIFNCSLDIELNKLINNIKLLSCTG